MSESLFRATTPDGRWEVSAEVSGEEFTGKVTLDGRNVIDSLTTSDPNRLISWMRRQMTEAMRRSA